MSKPVLSSATTHICRNYFLRTTLNIVTRDLSFGTFCFYMAALVGAAPDGGVLWTLCTLSTSRTLWAPLSSRDSPRKRYHRLWMLGAAMNRRLDDEEEDEEEDEGNDTLLVLRNRNGKRKC